METPLVYSGTPRTPSGTDSRFDTNRKRTAIDMLAHDKLFQWTECRIWINTTIVNDIREQQGAEQNPPTPAPARNAVTTFLKDPKKEKTGELLKQRYCESAVGLQGSAYFVFGLPRVRRIVKDVNDDLSVDQKADDRPRENKFVGQQETRNDRFEGSRRLGENRPDYKLGESRNDYKLGESRNDYKLGESRTDYKLGESRRLGESRNDYKFGESPPEYRPGDIRADFKLGESRADYKLGESRADRFGDTNRRSGGENEIPSISRTTSGRQDDRKPNTLGQSRAYDLSSSNRDDLRESRRPRSEPRAPEEPNLYSSRVAHDRRDPADDRKSWAVDPPLYASRVLPDKRPDPKERYDDIQSWRPQDQSPRSRENYPLPPPPPPPPLNLAPSGRYEGVIRR